MNPKANARIALVTALIVGALALITALAVADDFTILAGIETSPIRPPAWGSRPVAAGAKWSGITDFPERGDRAIQERQIASRESPQSPGAAKRY